MRGVLPASSALLLPSMLAAFAAVATLGGAARADVGVLPVRAQGFGDDAAVARSVLPTIRAVLGARAHELDVKPGCEESQRCRAEQIRDRIQEVAFIAVERLSDEQARLTLQVFDARGERVLAVAEEIPLSESAKATEALFRQAFDPGRYQGILEVIDAPPGADILVDGLRIEGSRAPLRVGQHVVEVVAADRSFAPVPVSIQFDKTTRVELLAVSPARPPWSPLPTVFAGSAALVGAVAAATFALLVTTAWPAQAAGWRDLVDTPSGAALTNDVTNKLFKEGYGRSGAASDAQRSFFVTGRAANELVAYDGQMSIGWIAVVTGGALATAGTAAAVATWTLGRDE
jgi:hypothetical protein